MTRRLVVDGAPYAPEPGARSEAEVDAVLASNLQRFMRATLDMRGAGVLVGDALVLAHVPVSSAATRTPPVAIDAIEFSTGSTTPATN